MKSERKILRSGMFLPTFQTSWREQAKVKLSGPKYTGCRTKVHEAIRNIRYRGTIGYSNVTYMHHIRLFDMLTAVPQEVGVATQVRPL